MTAGAQAALDERSAALCELAAEIASGGEDEWDGALAAARAASSDPEVEEVILQSYLFVGFPTVLNVLGAWRRLSPRPPARPEPALDVRVLAGTRLCRQVYGRAYERLREHVATLHPDLDRWMIEEGYGKTLSRDGLAAVERELCVVAQLAASGHVPQLRSHLRGALNLGADPGAVEAALEIGLVVAERNRDRGAPAPRELRAAWRDVRAAAGHVPAREALDAEGEDSCS